MTDLRTYLQWVLIKIERNRGWRPDGSVGVVKFFYSVTDILSPFYPGVRDTGTTVGTNQ